MSDNHANIIPLSEAVYRDIVKSSFLLVLAPQEILLLIIKYYHTQNLSEITTEIIEHLYCLYSDYWTLPQGDFKEDSEKETYFKIMDLTNAVLSVIENNVVTLKAKLDNYISHYSVDQWEPYSAYLANKNLIIIYIPRELDHG